jgi:hypothetical protein
LKKKLFSLTILCILICTLSLAFVPKIGAVTNPQPVGIIAVETTGIPGNVSGTQLSWNFNAFTANATTSSPTCTLNLTQTLAAENNNTLYAESISTPLNKTYADDGDYYFVSATNATVEGPFYADFSVNITLNDHYILNSSWITKLLLSVYANASIEADTNASLYIYNFTGSEWFELGAYLNHTTEFPANYVVSSLSNFSDFLNENNTIMPRFYWNDTTTDFNVTVDYVAVEVTYDMNITISDWTATQSETSYQNALVYSHTDTFNLTAPSGITDHNFTVYYLTPNAPLVTAIASTPTAEVSGESVSITDWSFPITNLVTNVTTISFNLPRIHLVNPTTAVTLSQAVFTESINRLSFTATGSGTQTIQVYITSNPYAIYADNALLGTANYTWSNNILTITLPLSTHTVEIYQYATPAIAPGPKPTPTPPAEVAPIIPAEAIPWIVVLALAVIAIIIYKKK